MRPLGQEDATGLRGIGCGTTSLEGPGFARLGAAGQLPISKKLAETLARPTIGKCPGGELDIPSYSTGGRPTSCVALLCSSVPGKEVQ